MRLRKLRLAAGFGSFLMAGARCFCQVPQYQITALSLPGPTYIGVNGTENLDHYAPSINAVGQIAGGSYRYNSQGNGLGADAWLYSGGTFQQIGLIGGVYGYSYSGAGGGTYQFSNATGINASGRVLGLSQRFASNGTSLGYDVWLYSGGQTTQLGLTGTGYVDPTTLRAVSNALGVTDSGTVAGDTVRFRGDGVSLGQDAWVQNGSTITFLGLTGPTYEEQYPGGGISRFHQVLGMNSSGQVMGTSGRVDSNGTGVGTDSWFYNGLTTQRIGLTGAGYSYTTQAGATYELSDVSQLNNAGQVVGYSHRYNSAGGAIGQDVWIWKGSSTTAIGLTGTGYGYTFAGNGGGTYSLSEANQLTANGMVLGVTDRYGTDSSPQGQDAWVYNGVQTKAVGLTGGSYAYTHGGQTLQSSSAVWANSHGQVVGTSNLYSNTGSAIGQDGWYYDGASTVKIGLSGPGYTYSSLGTPAQYVMPQTMNESGDVIGYNLRLTTSGQNVGFAAWFFDPKSDQTYQVGPSTYTNIVANAITPGGVVLGYFSATPTANHSFYWSESEGFVDLGTLIAGGLSAQGWQVLNVPIGSGMDAPDGTPQTILGEGIMNGRTDMTQFLLTQVPEPTMSAACALGALVLISARSRKPAC